MVRGSRSGHVSLTCFGAVWTRVISRRSQTYRCPLCFLLFGGGQELFLGGYKSSGTLIERGEQIEKGTLELDSGRFAVTSFLVL